VKKNTINLEINFNKEFLNNQINSINTSIAGLVEEPSYYIENNNLIITKGKAGIKINNDELLENIEKEILCIDENSKEMEIPVINKEPDEIDIEQIYNEIYREPQDAYITENPLTVHPNVNGVDFEMTLDEVNELLKEEKEEYIIPLKISIAQITVNDLGEDAFPNTLGTFTTRYDATNKNRSNNISLASEKINGTIILPGETFSYNQIVGKRTIEAGYKEAGAYAGGQVVQEVGGGICQVSSTLYNAVLYANLEIVDRSNHYFETSYVDAGRDATVSWGTVDFKFKNNKTYPIKVVAESNNGVCKISILGISEQNDYEVVIQSKQTSIIKKEVKYEEDDTLDEATEIVKQEGHDGCTSETYKILKQNGAEISRELISTDYYHALDKIIIIGTKNEITTEENDNELNVDDEVN
jgi:vancomycin resistance protein YoaR